MEPFLGLGLTTWLGGAVVALAIYFWNKKILNHYWKTKNVPADGPGFTFGMLGKMVLQGKTLFDLDEQQYKKHGRVHGLYFGYNPMIMVAEPELLRLIFIKDFHAFADRRVLSSDDVLGKMLPNLTGDEWKRMRSIVSPIFTSGKLRKVSSLITKSAKNITDSFLEHADSKTNVELKKLFGGFTLNVIASTAFATELDCIKNPDNIFATQARKVFNITFNWRIALAFIAPKLMVKMGIQPFGRGVMSFFSDLVSKIREQRMNAAGKVHDDFLQMLMDIESATAEEKEENDETFFGSEKETKWTVHETSKKTLSKIELIAQCVLFLLVGYDTTATTLSLVCYLLAQNQKCQESLLKEVDEIWEKHQGNIDYDAANTMKYLDAVVAETLRLYPLGARLERKCMEDYELGDTGITIPKGMFVGVPVYAMHKDPEYFPDPEVFNPERFLSENKESIKPYTYLPFGSGPRNCVGMRFAIMEIKLCLVDVLRHVSFHTCADTEIPLEYFNGGAIQPKKVTLRVERRR